MYLRYNPCNKPCRMSKSTTVSNSCGWCNARQFRCFLDWHLPFVVLPLAAANQGSAAELSSELERTSALSVNNTKTEIFCPKIAPPHLIHVSALRGVPELMQQIGVAVGTFCFFRTPKQHRFLSVVCPLATTLFFDLSSKVLGYIVVTWIFKLLMGRNGRAELKPLRQKSVDSFCYLATYIRKHLSS